MISDSSHEWINDHHRHCFLKVDFKKWIFASVFLDSFILESASLESNDSFHEWTNDHHHHCFGWLAPSSLQSPVKVVTMKITTQGKHLEDTCDNTQWRKAKQVQFYHFEATFETTQGRNVEEHQHQDNHAACPHNCDFDWWRDYISLFHICIGYKTSMNW